jgi:hypothetical protein
MTDAQLWWLTLEFAVLAVVVGGGGYPYARHITRKFDREWGDH